MRSVFVFVLLLIVPKIVEASTITDTMRIGSSRYVHYNKKEKRREVNARIIDDSLLVICDSAGVQLNYKPQRWVIAITKDGAYSDVVVTGSVLPLKCREWINEQPSGGWVCIEGVVVLMPDGTERKLPGEKWVKL